MENQEQNKKELLPMKSSTQSQSTLHLITHLTPECLAKNMEKIKNAFPSLPVGFYDVLCDRLKTKKFNDARLCNAVDGVIDTCAFPTPTVANFIMFDKDNPVYKIADGIRWERDEKGNYYDKDGRILYD